MDRNHTDIISTVLVLNVALRKESVDRNYLCYDTSITYLYVALRKESVDRNLSFLSPICFGSLSLSARRAWIEICKVRFHAEKRKVALRKESVDRNFSSLLLSDM